MTAFDLAQRFVGVKEVAGTASNPLVLAMLRLDDEWPQDDAVPWCSAFVNYVAWLLRLPRSKSLAARSWLDIGRVVALDEARVGFDVVILSREGGGHVGWFAGLPTPTTVALLGGNQGDAVTVASFTRTRVLGVRRLTEATSV
jgi:uncharacterized protein (TIGR02594 family)